MNRFLLLTLLSLPLPAFAQAGPFTIPYTGTLNVSADRTLTRDVTGRIRITADNVTLDCAGHTISPWVLGKQCGTHGGACGIIVEDRTNVTLQNCNVTGHDIGIWIGTSTGVIVASSTAQMNTAGFRIDDSSDVLFDDNIAVDNTAEGFVLRDTDYATLSSNTSASNGTDGFDQNGGDHAVYLQNISYENGVNGFEMDVCADAEYTENYAWENGQHGISLDGVTGGILDDNDIRTNGVDGLRLDDSAGVGTTGFDVTFNYSAFNGDDAAMQCSGLCTGNVFIGNTFVGPTPGIP